MWVYNFSAVGEYEMSGRYQEIELLWELLRPLSFTWAWECLLSVRCADHMFVFHRIVLRGCVCWPRQHDLGCICLNVSSELALGLCLREKGPISKFHCGLITNYNNKANLRMSIKPQDTKSLWMLKQCNIYISSHDIVSNSCLIEIQNLRGVKKKMLNKNCKKK